MGDYTVKHLDDMEAIYGGAFRRTGASLGVESFGMQVFDKIGRASCRERV